MKFIFSWKKDFNRSLHSLMKYFFHTKLNFMSLRHRVISSINHIIIVIVIVITIILTLNVIIITTINFAFPNSPSVKDSSKSKKHQYLVQLDNMLTHWRTKIGLKGKEVTLGERTGIFPGL